MGSLWRAFFRRPPERRRPSTPSLAVLAVVLAAVSAGCGNDPTTVPSPGRTTAVSSPAAPSDAPPATTSSAPGTPAATGTPEATESAREAPTRPTAPAASTAGELTAQELPQEVLGFRAAAREATEGEYVPNGSWVHAVPGEQAGYEAMPQCPGNEGGWPTPAHALAGTYLDAQQRPGNVLALQFADVDQARGYATAYRTVLAGCPRTGGTPAVTEVAATGAWYVGRRDYDGERWSEIVLWQGDRVLLLIINDDHASTPDQLRGFAARLAEG